MQLKHSIAIALVACGAALQSCQQDRINVTDAKELYTRDFIKQFGIADPNHDWNMATRGGVSVTTSTPTNVKVYAKVGGKRYLFADYKNVNGTEAIEFDIPKGVEQLIVRANGRDYSVNNGASIRIDRGSRLITEPGSTTDNKLEWSISRERMLSTEALNLYIETYPEEKPNLGKGTTSFYFVADGEEHTFYPFYWQTSAKHTLGIYYIPDEDKPDEIVMQDLYFTKSGELKINGDGACNPEIPADLVYHPGDVHIFKSNKFKCSDWATVFPGFRTTLEAYKEDTSTELHNYILSDGKALGDISGQYGTERIYTSEATADFITDNGYISRIKYDNYAFEITETVTKEYTTPTGYPRNGFSEAVKEGKAYENAKFICTRGITYKLEKGTKYGFYIKVNHSTTGTNFYTEENGVQTPKPLEEQPYDFIIFSQASRNKTYIDSKIKDGTSDDMNKSIREFNWRDTNGDGNASTWWNEDFTENDEYAYASWDIINMGGKDYAMFGFEDWEAHTNNVGPDLNDLMFLFETGTRPSEVVDEDDPEPEDKWFEWILAAEDLGNVLCDWDFNDMVVKISVLAVKEDGAEQATTKLKVEPLASGGTLPVYLMYTGKIGNDTEAKTYVIGKEFHEWFGSSSLNPINVSKGSTASLKAEAITLDVPKSYTIAGLHEHYKPGEDGTNNMGGFWFIANRSDGMTEFNPTDTWPYKEINKSELPDNGKVNYIVAPDKESLAPQMICVEGSWMWPYESKFISEAYLEFETWIKDASHTSWYKGADGNSKHTEGSVIKR